jgi:hypothetical protein
MGGSGSAQIKQSKGTMPKSNHSGLAKLDRQLQALSDDLEDLSSEMSLKRLRLLIRRPGWTTPAELMATVAAMRAQARSLNRQLASLLNASVVSHNNSSHKLADSKRSFGESARK